VGRERVYEEPNSGAGRSFTRGLPRARRAGLWTLRADRRLFKGTRGPSRAGGRKDVPRARAEAGRGAFRASWDVGRPPNAWLDGFTEGSRGHGFVLTLELLRRPSRTEVGMSRRAVMGCGSWRSFAGPGSCRRPPSATGRPRPGICVIPPSFSNGDAALEPNVERIVAIRPRPAGVRPGGGPGAALLHRFDGTSGEGRRYGQGGIVPTGGGRPHGGRLPRRKTWSGRINRAPART